jgi:hypothetical protein
MLIEVAFVADQESVVAWPAVIVVALAERVAVGVMIGGGETEGCGGGTGLPASALVLLFATVTVEVTLIQSAILFFTVPLPVTLMLAYEPLGSVLPTTQKPSTTVLTNESEFIPREPLRTRYGSPGCQPGETKRPPVMLILGLYAWMIIP